MDRIAYQWQLYATDSTKLEIRISKTEFRETCVSSKSVILLLTKYDPVAVRQTLERALASQEIENEISFNNT